MTTTVLAPPRPGRTVLACRCGKALNLADLHWLPARLGERRPVPWVGCAACARNRAW